MSGSTFVEVLLPLPLNQTLTYKIPDALIDKVVIGSRVVVSLGPKKLYTGFVAEIHTNQPETFHVKEILEVLDSLPMLLGRQLEFWKWIASYYMCTVGEVLHAALPSGLKLESETRLRLVAPVESEDYLSEQEKQIVSNIELNQVYTLKNFATKIGNRRALVLLQSLVDKGLVEVFENLNQSKQKGVSMIQLDTKYETQPELVEIEYAQLSRAKKQQQLLGTFLLLSKFGQISDTQPVERSLLLEESNCNASVLLELIRKKIFIVTSKLLEDTPVSNESEKKLKTLSVIQNQALNDIRRIFKQKEVCLLYGKTASGKTEVYNHLIQDCIQSGKQVLYLVPEIALTTQLSSRLERVFGNDLGVYHSKISDAARVDMWRKMLSEQPYKVILGARSSVFLPFKELGLIVVDEEHEGSYKQQDPSPRYHARSAAIVLAAMYQAKTLLGTATPSMETYENCMCGKYGLVQLDARYNDQPLPEILTVDVGELKRKKRMKGAFSPLLLDHISKSISEGGQVLIFQNRRGFAPMLECRNCGWIPKCEQCDVSLTYHKAKNTLTCHYCGTEYHLPKVCKLCETPDLKTVGVGTEQVEEEIKTHFPDIRVSRMDTDSTRSRKSYEQIIGQFEAGEIDVLIGTQMISKGLDFNNVRVVGILNADHLLNFPDFRAHEKSFQLLVQVSGRAGRKDFPGLVILQTSNPKQRMISHISNNNFESYFHEESEIRKMFGYPPFSRLVQLRIKHKDAQIVHQAAMQLCLYLKPYFGNQLLGPDTPLISKVKYYYLQQMLLKLNRSVSTAKVRAILHAAQKKLNEDQRYKSVVVQFDVDPF